MTFFIRNTHIHYYTELHIFCNVFKLEERDLIIFSKFQEYHKVSFAFFMQIKRKHPRDLALFYEEGI